MFPQRQPSDPTVSRRRFLTAATGVVAAGAVPTVGHAAGPDTDDHQPELDETPTTATLRDLAVAGETFAVGDGGTVLRRGDERWHATAFSLEADLVAASSDGSDLWVAGRDGSVSLLRPETGQVVDRSPPGADAATLTDLTVPDRSGGPTVYATDRSGVVHWSPDGGQSWNRVTPASGASFTAVDHHCPCVSHAVDTNGTVVALRRQGGTGPLRTEIVGVPDADVNYYGVVSHGHVGGMRHRSTGAGGMQSGSKDHGGVTVVGGNGTVAFTHDGDWRRHRVGGETLRGVVARQRGDRAVGVAVGDGGTALAFGFPKDGESRHHEVETPVQSTLHATMPAPDGDSERDLLAVGGNGVALDT